MSAVRPQARDRPPAGRRIACGLVVCGALLMGVRVQAQTADVRVVEDHVVMELPGTTSLLSGRGLERLREGEALTLELELDLLAEPDGSVLASRRGQCNISYDLWEERFAVSLRGERPRSVSHLGLREAEAWCLERLRVPRAPLAGRGRDTPFWARLAYRVDGRARTRRDESAFTLERLIDLLARRDEVDALAGVVDGGPFFVPD